MCEIVYGVCSRSYRKKRETKSAEEMMSKYYNGNCGVFVVVVVCFFFNILLTKSYIVVSFPPMHATS